MTDLIEAPLPDDVAEVIDGMRAMANEHGVCDEWADMLERLAREIEIERKMNGSKAIEALVATNADLEQRIEELENECAMWSPRCRKAEEQVDRLDAALADLWDYVENMESEHNTPHVGLFMSTKPEHREIIETSTRKARARE